MSKIFLPSCKIKSKYRNSSEKLKSYLEEKEKIREVGCCKVFCRKTEKEDEIVVICNNCGAIMDESSASVKIEYVWEIIDRDEEFPFPNYHGEKMAIQDCWRAYDKRNMQNAIRSLMKKMNIEIIELEENFHNTKFCGMDLLEPCTDVEKKFAPRRYWIEGANRYQNLSTEDQKEYLKKHCEKIMSNKVVCYCLSCLDGIKVGGKEAIHLIELLFPENGK